MGGGVGVGRAVDWLEAAGALVSGTTTARATATEGGNVAIEWLAEARTSASGTASARETAAGRSEDSGVRSVAAKAAE